MPWPLQSLLFFLWRITRGMTLGVRAIVLSPESEVFLVRHTYVKGWHFPGGGVDRGETFRAAMERELREEANIALGGEPELHGVFRNASVSKRDHIACFVVRDFSQGAAVQPGREIAEARFFPLDALPEGTTRATRQRLEEIRGGMKAPEDW